MRRKLGLLALIIIAAVIAAIVLLPRPSHTASNAKTYAALGDSVAAGLGLPPAQLADTQDKLCGRSGEAYPVLLALQQHLTLHNYACSGAKTNDLGGQQQVKSSLVPSQIDRAFAAGPPSVITISIGANDLDFSSVLASCYVKDCATPAETAVAEQRIAKVQTDVSTVLQQIKTKGGSPLIIVVGYYQLVSPGCTRFAPQVTADEVAWIDARTDDLNTALQTAARQNGARYAASDFSGHSLCSNDSWIQGLNSAGALHPTAAGQAAIAKTIEQTISR